jgi:Tol biopolymer transport system component
MDITSIQATLLYSDPNYNCASPSYSYDGRYILFQKGVTIVTQTSRRSTVTSVSGRWQLFTIRSNGTSLSPLTVGDVDAYSPSWDANGFIYFISNASGKTEIYRARVNLD